LSEALSDGLDLEFVIDKQKHIVFLVAFEHSDVLNFTVRSKIIFVKLKTRRKIALACQRHYFFHRVVLLVVCSSFLNPTKKKLVMKGTY
jgi:uncharacterized protein (DUF924 family)